MADKHDDEVKKEDSSKGGDIHGTIHDGETPPKKIKLFFSKRIWITVISFIVLTVIGGIIEFTVQTPISKYIERLTGPRLRTLKKQIRQGNHEFVYRSIKSKFHDEPYDKNYDALYRESTEGFLRDLIKEHEWEKASRLLQEAIEGMPVSKDHRLYLRQIYMAAQSERFRLFKKMERGDPKAGERLGALWREVEGLALKEKDDPIVQYETGRTLAELDWVGGRYNLYSLEYFERAIELDSHITDKEILFAVLDQALEQNPGNKMTEKAQHIIQTYFFEEYLPRLKDTLKPYAFKENQVVEESEQWNKRTNGFYIISNSDNVEEKDSFRFYLMALAHLTWLNEKNTEVIKQAKEYFKNLAKTKKFAKVKKAAELPRIVPVSVITEGKTDKKHRAVWPLISGQLASIFEGYCHKMISYKHDIDVQRNCYRLLKKTGKLTSKEKQKYQSLGL